MWEQKETQESEGLRSWERFAVRLFGLFFFFVKIPFFKENLAVVCMLPVQWDMQVAAGHCRSSCLLEQVLDYKGKLRNLLKYFYQALFMQPHEDLSPLLSSGVQVVAL